MRFRVLFLMLALLLSACGSTTTPDAGTAGDSDDQATTTEATVDATDEDTDATGLPSAECVSIGLALSQAASMGMIGQGAPEDAAATLAELAAEVPDEVADDFEVMAEAFAEFAAALEDAGVDFSDPASLSSPEAQSAIAAAGEAFSTPEVEAASENMSAFLEGICEG